MISGEEIALLTAVENKFTEAQLRIDEAMKILRHYRSKRELRDLGGVSTTPRRDGLYPGQISNHVPDEIDECTS